MLLDRLGISIPALQTAGLAVSGGAGHGDIPCRPPRMRIEKPVSAVFPLATPLIAGPGAIGAAILLMTNAGNDLYQQLAVVSSLGFVR